MAVQRRDFTPQEIERVWQLAIPVEGFSPDQIRRDYAGALIMKEYYGDRNSIFGWEIDHIIPIEKGGYNVLWNYAPLQWENNMQKSDNFPYWQTKVAFNDASNYESYKDWFGVVSGESVAIIPVKK